MRIEHYYSLYAAYGTALIVWLVVLQAYPRLWPKPDSPRFAKPWRELGYALLAAIAIVGMGQLYTAGYRLPARGSWGPLFETVNQIVIFAPIGVLLWLRGHGPATVWLPRKAIPIRLLMGVAIALIVLFIFTTVKFRPNAYPDVIRNIYQPANSQFLAQVFFEDVAIAMLMVRFAAAVRRPWIAAIVVGVLFAAAHIPAMLVGGASLRELHTLSLDAVLAVTVVRVLLRAADIWWFFVVHFTMDMTQFV